MALFEPSVGWAGNPIELIFSFLEAQSLTLSNDVLRVKRCQVMGNSES
ncbi:hypothetical protein SAMN05216308_103154 [Nitrosospira sp. Nsp13]|nr:hypothetical protein SAMN05216308_103154 [Nitrosospira sp. Nsp13]